MILRMSQTHTLSAPDWCADLQIKLMAALDAAWAMIERSDDPAVIAKARAKGRACGQMAADARKITAMTPQPKPHLAQPRQLPAMIQQALDQLDAPPAPQPPAAAQAVAMKAALRKLKRR